MTDRSDRFADEHGVNVRQRWDNRLVFSVDGLAFRQLEAQRRIRDEGYEIVRSESIADGDHYIIIAEDP